MSQKVLIVDDDANLLQGLRRQLRRTFDLAIAEGPEEGLERLESDGPFAVVVSDMQMPQMTGVEFLARIRDMSPETVRIMLTGNADQQTAVDAVNDGHIFRFLNKPCTKEDLSKAIEAGLEQHRLITAEKELVSKTLTGSVRVLTDVLSLVSPYAFCRAARIRQTARQLAAQLNLKNAWECEIAAMLSQIGFATLPEELQRKVEQRARLTPEERQEIQLHPQRGGDLVSHIPRLGNVAKAIRYQAKQFDGEGFPEEEELRGSDLPVASRILCVALEFDEQVSRGVAASQAYVSILEAGDRYDPEVVKALSEVIKLQPNRVAKQIPLVDLKQGHVLAANIEDTNGTVLMRKDQEVSDSALVRLRAFAKQRKLKEPVSIFTIESSDSVREGSSDSLKMTRA